MAEVNRRRFSENQLAGVFRILDSGGTRDDVRAYVKRAQNGRGVSNDTIKALRESHRQLRRSQGYNVKVGGTRNLRDASGNLKRLNTLPPRQRIASSRRPRPPVIPGVRMEVTVMYETRHQGRLTGVYAVDVFEVGDDAPSLAAQIAEAAETTGGSDPPVGEKVPRSGGGPQILRVKGL